MARVEDVKMAALVAMILLAAAISGQGKDRVGQVEPFLMQAPAIETQVLAG
ncbi:hypothetical protein HW561_01995 [Rhodobacteraceae bacterium B1Z28]|uniref:Uncharacterized protein n=1 Tax=Ruegeria haliotis TaxID=2747601 RepID=A0ABX2PKL1_9RHOB|nr:hypothetical protein [Ruegeria haliotis]NVO54558.1 hypothetical protein [Ruegeria haliotis]